MARRKKGRPVNGILLLDKPQGITSNKALQEARFQYFAQKAGHTGSLDPMATGVLPICFGEATKFSQFLLDSDKAYKATIRFGQTTTTGDAEGEILDEMATENLDEEAVLFAIKAFVGEYQQMPPMFSALKHEGRPLYEYARKGIEIPRASRPVTIHAIELEAFRPAKHAEADIYVSCSKGTYIRTLAEDIAKSLGLCGGHLTALCRVQAGDYTLDQTISLEGLKALKSENAFEEMDKLLFSPEEAVKHLPVVEVSEIEGYHVRQGQALFVPNAPLAGFVRIREENGTFLGIGEMLEDGRVGPKRLIASE